MLSLFQRLHPGASSYKVLRTDIVDNTAPLDGRTAPSASTPTATAECRFTQDHEAALCKLQGIVKAQSSSASADAAHGRCVPSESLFLDPAFLSLLVDLHEARHEAPRLSTRLDHMEDSRIIGRESVSFLANLLGRERLPAAKLLAALTSPHDGRAPCLLRLASAAVHDLPLATAMCDLLTALARSRDVGPDRLRESLLKLDCPLDARCGDALPDGMRLKYTDFLGRLIGDGQGEWRNDGAVYAVARLRDEHLLPEREQVVSRHSKTRWQKQERFIQLCDALRVRAPWQHPEPPPLSIPDLAGRIDALQSSLTTARSDATGARGSEWDTVVDSCVDDALAQGWRMAREQHEALFLDQVSLPGSGLAIGKGGPLAELCLPGLGRLPKRPPAPVVDRLIEKVLRDPTLRESRAQAEVSGKIRPACRALVAETARRHVEDALDLSDRLAEFLPEPQVDCYLVRLTSDGAIR